MEPTPPGGGAGEAATRRDAHLDASLSDQERQVAQLLRRGLARERIAAELGLSAEVVARATERIVERALAHLRARRLSPRSYH